MTDFDDEKDFGAILAEFESGQESDAGSDPEIGDRVSGKVLSIGGDTAFVDVGAKTDAVVATAELLDRDGDLTVGVGDTVEGMVTGTDEAGCLILRVRPGAASGLGAGDTELALQEVEQAKTHGIAVEGTVSEAVKGGVRVNVSGLRAFCPISQLDTVYVENAEDYVGRRLRFLVRKFERAGRGGKPDVVLSRRDVLEEEERQRREELLAELEPGSVVRGTVTSVTSYGAFVDLGGIEGLLHVSEMAHGRIEDPSTVVSEGDNLEVKVLKIEDKEGRDGKRISLSRRALMDDPWDDVADRFSIGETVPGMVKRLETYGAFVEIAPGVEGLVHISEMSGERRVGHPKEVVDLGHEVQVRILDVDTERQRISLSMAAAAREGEEEYAGREEGGGLGSALGSMAEAFEKAKPERDGDAD